MARKAVQELYCARLIFEGINIYLASSMKGAVRIEARLEKGHDPVAYFKKLYPSARLVEDDSMNRLLAEAVKAALEGRAVPKDLGLDIAHTPFQLRVWKRIAKIPFGKTMTYGEVARAVGSPGAVRAVGQAMARNPLPLIFP